MSGEMLGAVGIWCGAWGVVFIVMVAKRLFHKFTGAAS